MTVWMVAHHGQAWSATTAIDTSSSAVPVRPIAAIRGMPLTEAARGEPVSIRGVVTFLAREHIPKEAVIVQDATGGIWVSLEHLTIVPQDLRRGSEVEIEGVTDRGGFAPNLNATMVRVLGTGPLPEPLLIDDERLFSGADTCSCVTVDGILQGYRNDGKQWRLILERAGRRFLASVPKSVLKGDPATLVDARLGLTGLLTSRFNTRGEFVSPKVTLQQPDSLTVLEPPRTEPFDAPFVPLDSVAQFRPQPIGGHRIRTEGTVTFVEPDTFIQVQDGPVGVRVHTRASESVAVGDRVEIAGFLDRGRDTAGLAEAVVRRVGRAPALEPTPITPDKMVEIIAEAHRAGLVAKPGNYDGCLIRFAARLVEIEQIRAGGVLTLASGQSILRATLRGPDFSKLTGVQPGSTLEVTGIIQIDLSDVYEDRERWFNPNVARLELLLRSAADVVVTAAPSWWTPQRLAFALAAVAGVLAVVLTWVWALRRQLGVQTAKLADEMRSRREAAVEFEATLRERNRLAANLHDTLLQSLAGIRFQLDACRLVSRQGRDDDSAEHFAVARRMLDHAAQDLRGSVWALRTMPMPGQTFSESIDTLVSQFSRSHHTPIVLNAAGQPFEVPNFVAGNLLLVAQEAIHNSIQHGRAHQIDVHVGFDPHAAAIELVVHDDGQGFEPHMVIGPAQGHFGLRGMRERVERLGGEFRVVTSPGEGTTIHVTVTLRDYDHRLEEGTGSITAGEELSAQAPP
jgi:signal transduction histidine kinase